VGRTIHGSVQIVDTTSGETTEVAPLHFSAAVYVSWSPAADLLLVLSSNLGSGWYQLQLTSVDLIDLTTGRIDVIAKETLAASYPVWSPDGSQFAMAEGNDMIQIRSMTGSIRWITVPRSISPMLTWSLDGSALFAPSNNPGRASMIVPVDGREIADMPIFFSDTGPPRWSPIPSAF
jgi:hypothetical protein